MPGLETFQASRWPLTFCLSSLSFKIVLILLSSAERSCLLVKKPTTWVVLLSALIFNFAPSSPCSAPVFLILNIATESFCVVPGILLKPPFILSFSLPGSILTGLGYSFAFVLAYGFLLSSFVRDLLIYELIKELAGQPHCSFRIPPHFLCLSSETMLLLICFWRGRRGPGRQTVRKKHSHHLAWIFLHASPTSFGWFLLLFHGFRCKGSFNLLELFGPMLHRVL